jgi:hypothetical protein
MLGLPVCELVSLDNCFSKADVWAVISAMPADKAPGPDGFMALFYQTAWLLIKRDIMQALAALWSLDCRSLDYLNQAYLVLLRKKEDAEEVKAFWLQ